jgi:carbonic anhydrase
MKNAEVTMEEGKGSISRRGLFRFGALTVLTAAAAPLIHPAHADAQPEVCNPEAPDTPEDALAALVAGNRRWYNGNQQHPNEDIPRRNCLATNPQTPYAAILSCSDSRCAPELVFDQGVGDIFVARVAGNTASGRLIDSLLYGVSQTGGLGAKLLFVMGHSACGAVINSFRVYPKPNKDLPFLNLLFPAVKTAKLIVKARGGDPNDEATVVPVATQQNVILTALQLRKYLGLAANEVAGGVYDLGRFKVDLVPIPS